MKKTSTGGSGLERDCAEAEISTDWDRIQRSELTNSSGLVAKNLIVVTTAANSRKHIIDRSDSLTVGARFKKALLFKSTLGAFAKASLVNNFRQPSQPILPSSLDRSWRDLVQQSESLLSRSPRRSEFRSQDIRLMELDTKRRGYRCSIYHCSGMTNRISSVLDK